MPAAFNVPFAARTGRNSRVTVNDDQGGGIIAMGKWNTAVSGTDVEIRNFELVLPGFNYGIVGLLSLEYGFEGAWNFLTNYAALPFRVFPGSPMGAVRLWLRKDAEHWLIPESRILNGTQQSDMGEFLNIAVSGARASGSWFFPGGIPAVPPDI